jgi:hypothetical protein
MAAVAVRGGRNKLRQQDDWRDWHDCGLKSAAPIQACRCCGSPLRYRHADAAGRRSDTGMPMLRAAAPIQARRCCSPPLRYRHVDAAGRRSDTGTPMLQSAAPIQARRCCSPPLRYRHAAANTSERLEKQLTSAYCRIGIVV